MPLPPHIGKSQIENIALMLARGIDASQIKESFSLNDAEYEHIVNSESFTRFVNQKKADNAGSKISRAATWDSLEQLAIAQTLATLPTTNDPLKSAQIAKIANSAARPLEPKQPDAGFAAIVISSDMSAYMAAQLRRQRDIMEGIIDMPKMSSVPNVTAIQEFLEGKK